MGKADDVESYFAVEMYAETEIALENRIESIGIGLEHMAYAADWRHMMKQPNLLQKI